MESELNNFSHEVRDELWLKIKQKLQTTMNQSDYKEHLDKLQVERAFYEEQKKKFVSEHNFEKASEARDFIIKVNREIQDIENNLYNNMTAKEKWESKCVEIYEKAQKLISRREELNNEYYALMLPAMELELEYKKEIGDVYGAKEIEDRLSDLRKRAEKYSQ